MDRFNCLTHIYEPALFLPPENVVPSTEVFEGCLQHRSRERLTRSGRRGQGGRYGRAGPSSRQPAQAKLKSEWHYEGLCFAICEHKNLIVRVLHLFLRHSLNSLFQLGGRPSLRTLELILNFKYYLTSIATYERHDKDMFPQHHRFGNTNPSFCHFHLEKVSAIRKLTKASPNCEALSRPTCE